MAEDHRTAQRYGRSDDRQQAYSPRDLRRLLERGATNMKERLDEQEISARLQTGAHFPET